MISLYKAKRILGRRVGYLDLREWANLIDSGESECVYRKNADLSFHRIEWQGKEFIALHHAKLQRVVAIYSKERWEKGSSKQKGDRNHFATRMEQRYGFEITREDIDEIVQQIQSGQSQYLGRATQTRSYHKVNWRNQDFVILYSSRTKSPVTVYPPNGTIYPK